MNTVLALPAGSNDLAVMDPTERMVMGFLAKYRGSTLQAYQADLKHFLGWCGQMRLNPMTAEEPHLELYVRYMQEDGRWSESTISRRIGTVCSMYRTAKRQRLLDHNPAEYVERPKIDREKQRCTYLTPVEFGTLTKYVENSGTVMERAYFALLGLRGLRIAEACSLDVDDYFTQQGYKCLKFIGKGNRARIVQVPPPGQPPLEAAIGDRTEGPILLNEWGNRMNRVNGSTMVKRLATNAGVNADISNHSLRRSFVTFARAMNVSYDDIAETVGHRSVNTTMRYDRLTGSIHRDHSGEIAARLMNIAS